jgi:hypothetical protein
MTAQFTGLIPLTQIHDRSIYWLDTPNTQIHDHSIYWLGTDTSIKRYGNKVVYGSKPPLSDLLYWTYNKLFADFDSINCTFYWSYFPLWWNENNICFFHNLLFVTLDQMLNTLLITLCNLSKFFIIIFENMSDRWK